MNVTEKLPDPIKKWADEHGFIVHDDGDPALDWIVMWNDGPIFQFKLARWEDKDGVDHTLEIDAYGTDGEETISVFGYPNPNTFFVQEVDPSTVPLITGRPHGSVLRFDFHGPKAIDMGLGWDGSKPVYAYFGDVSA